MKRSSQNRADIGIIIITIPLITEIIGWALFMPSFLEVRLLMSKTAGPEWALRLNQEWLYTPLVPALRELEAGRSQRVSDQPGPHTKTQLIKKKNKKKKHWFMES